MSDCQLVVFYQVHTTTSPLRLASLLLTAETTLSINCTLINKKKKEVICLVCRDLGVEVWLLE